MFIRYYKTHMGLNSILTGPHCYKVSLITACQNYKSRRVKGKIYSDNMHIQYLYSATFLPEEILTNLVLSKQSVKIFPFNSSSSIANTGGL